jgi:thymidylate kinase
MQNLPALTGALFRFLNEEHVEYCALGSGAAPLRLIVSQASRPRMAGVLRSFGAHNDLQLIDHRHAPEEVEIFGLSLTSHEQRPQFVDVEVRSDYLRCGRIVFTADELLRDRLPTVDPSSHGSGYFRAAPAKEFLCHLLRAIDAGAVTDSDGSHLSELWRQDSTGVGIQVERFWNGAREGGVILRAATSGNWDAVHASARPLQNALRLRNVVPPGAWVREKRRALREWWRPKGLLIACLGPEGSGKSSVIEALREHPLQPFRDVHTMDLRPGVMRPGTVKANSASRRRAPRGRFGTIAKLMMFVADYWLGYWLQIRSRLVRTSLVVSDRYFDDVLVDPRRYRMERPRAFARILLRWVPRPELWLVFDLPSEALQARQTPLPADEAARQRAEYRRLLRGHENVVVLDADQPLEQVVNEAERAIVTQLALRTARRLGLPLETPNNPTATKLLLFFCRRNVPIVSRLVRVLFNSDIYCRLPPDVHLPYPYGVVIHPEAVIGRRVTIMQQVTLGGRDLSENIAPVIGDDVYIGAGARVLGDVRIGQGVVIGANAVVTRDIPPGVTVVGANRIVGAARGAHAATPPADPTVARFPVGAQRSSRTTRSR